MRMKTDAFSLNSVLVLRQSIFMPKGGNKQWGKLESRKDIFFLIFKLTMKKMLLTLDPVRVADKPE